MPVMIYSTPGKPCMDCGQNFQPRNARELRCQKCIHGDRPMPDLVCKCCHKKFEYIPGRVYCSPECSRKGYTENNLRYNREKKRIQAQVMALKRICPICHKEFALQGKRIYCSTQCQDTARRERVTVANRKRSEKNRQYQQAMERMKIQGQGAALQFCAPGKEPVPVKVENIRALNQVKKQSDALMLRERNIDSPNEKKMPYCVENKRLHVKFYFKTREKYLAFLKKYPEQVK